MKKSAVRIILLFVKTFVYGIVAFICSDLVNMYNLSFCSNIFEYAFSPIIFWEIILICLVPTVIIFTIVDILVSKRIKTTYFEIFLPFIIDFPVSIVVLFVSNTEYLGVTYIILLLVTMRAFAVVIELLVRKKYKQTAAFLPLIVISMLSYSLLAMYQGDLRKNIAGTPDATGSWGAINQNIERDNDWQQIVNNSPFKVKFTDEPSEDMGYLCYSDTYPVIDGSTVCVPLAVEFARQHLGMDDKTANSFVNFSTTHEAYVNLMNKTAKQCFWMNDEYYELVPSGEGIDIFLGTQPSAEEIELAAENGVNFVKKAVCYDAFVFITHKDNPVDSLSVEQIQQIYSGKIDNWKEVGGNNRKIKAYQREANSGSQTAMEQLVMEGIEMCAPIKVPIVVAMGELIDAVAEYKNKTVSIGYTYKYYIDILYKNDNIKTLAVNGIEPTNENIRTGVYPFSTSYYGVIRQGDELNTGGKFLDWILSEEGQKCVEQAGYIPVTDF